MGQVLSFNKKPTRHLPQSTDRENHFLVGYAAAICDVWRGGEDASSSLDQSGMVLEDFQRAGVEEYDLETLTEIYKHV